jgi:hypothetical protein
MTKVFEDEECLNLVLSIILKRNIETKRSVVQRFIQNLKGRSLQLDIFAMDEFLTCYNLEVQNKADTGILKRSRYHSSLIDASMSLAGDNFKELCQIYVIFIIDKDIFKKKKALYIAERTLLDDGMIIDDDEHIIYVNGEYEGDDELGRLMHDFKCTNPDDMYYEILRNRVKYFKEGKGQEEMCEIWEKIENKGIVKGKLEEKISTLLKLLTKKFGKTITIELQTEIENSDIETLNEVTEVIFDVENEEDVLKVLHHSY